MTGYTAQSRVTLHTDGLLRDFSAKSALLPLEGKPHISDSQEALF